MNDTGTSGSDEEEDVELEQGFEIEKELMVLIENSDTLTNNSDNILKSFKSFFDAEHELI